MFSTRWAWVCILKFKICSTNNKIKQSVSLALKTKRNAFFSPLVEECLRDIWMLLIFGCIFLKRNVCGFCLFFVFQNIDTNNFPTWMQNGFLIDRNQWKWHFLRKKMLIEKNQLNAFASNNKTQNHVTFDFMPIEVDFNEIHADYDQLLILDFSHLIHLAFNAFICFPMNLGSTSICMCCFVFETLSNTVQTRKYCDYTN